MKPTQVCCLTEIYFILYPPQKTIRTNAMTFSEQQCVNYVSRKEQTVRLGKIMQGPLIYVLE